MNTRIIGLSAVFIGVTVFFVSMRFMHVQGKSIVIDLKKALLKENVVDIAIIGSGPAGLQAAVYGGRGHFNTLVLEGREPGGLLTKTTLVENWPGEVSILGPTIMQKMKTQAQYHGAEFGADTVTAVDFSTYPFEIQTEDGHTLYALSVIIATGATPKKLGIPGEEEFWGMGVTTCAICDAPFFKGLDVVVVGGGDSAVEEAMQLAPYAKQITIMVRGNAMRAAPSMQARLKGYSNITIRYNVQLKEIQGDKTGVTHIQVFNNQTNETTQEPISGVFLAIGHQPNSWIFKDQIELHESGHIVVDCHSQQTSVPGVFVAGDVADREFRQAGVAAGDGIRAALSASKFLMSHGYNEVLATGLSSRRTVVYDKQLENILKPLHSIQDYLSLVKNKPGIVIMDFYADYCPSCLHMLPALNAVAHQFQSQVQFFKVDIEKAPELIKELSVFKVPCLLAFKDGALVARYNETMTKSELVSFVKSLISAE